MQNCKKTCIITGASKGIGRAVSIKLSQREDISKFALIARNKEELEQTKRMMRKDKKVLLHSIDLSNYQAIQDTVDRISKDFLTIDMLINVAGYVDPKSLLEISNENWEKTFKVNTGAVFVMIRESVKHMKKTGGKIVNIASTAGMSSRPGWLAYAASKAAVINMSSTLAEELEEYGIKVYCISPGRCATDLRRLLAPEEDPTTIMQPDDVAEFIDQLISSLGDCLDSQNIVVRKKIG